MGEELETRTLEYLQGYLGLQNPHLDPCDCVQILTDVAIPVFCFLAPIRPHYYPNLLSPGW